MSTTKIPRPDLVRQLEGSFSWIDHRIKWFWEDMSPAELLLYFFLVSTSDAAGCSWYSSRQICKILKIGPATLISARGTLEQRLLIAANKDEFSGRTIYQVLPLPIDKNVSVEIPIKPKIQKNSGKPKQDEAPQSELAQEAARAVAPEERVSRNLKHLENIQNLLKNS